MKTILYNTQTAQTEGKIWEGGYNEIYNSDLSKQVGWLPEHIIELTVIQPDRPTTDHTQYVTGEWVIDTEAGEYRYEWTVHNKTNEQLIEDRNNESITHEQQIRERLMAEMVEEKTTQVRAELETMTDEEAFNNKDLYPPYQIGKTYKTDDRFYYPLDGKLYKVIGAEHTSQLDWKPDTAVSLYKEITGQGDNPCDTAPLWESKNYAEGSRVKWENAVWEAINETHTWIAPAHSGDGSISWKWIKDCEQ